jgi:hypothetical protein
MTNFERLKTDIQTMNTATDFEDYLYEELGLDCGSCTEIDCIECICDKLDESKTEVDDDFMMNEKICVQCQCSEICYMLKNIKLGHKYYSNYFGEGVLCPNFIEK